MGKILNEQPRFYSFRFKYYYNTFRISPDIFERALRTGDYTEKREIHHYLALGKYPEWLEFPVIFHQFEGNKLRDILDMGCGSFPFVISNRMKNLLEENQVTGWNSFPIIIFDKKENVIPGYYGFSITGRGGDYEGSNMPGWLDRKPWKYNLSNWDGSDIFFISGTVIVTERIKIILEKNKIDKTEFHPFSEFAEFV